MMINISNLSKEVEPSILGFKEAIQEIREVVRQTLLSYKESLQGVDLSLVEWERLAMGTTDPDQQHDLRQYKSSLLQMKSDLIGQQTQTEKILSDLNKSLDLLNKVIQLRTGDIF